MNEDEAWNSSIRGVEESRDGPEDGASTKGDGSGERPVERMTVPEAAEVLGVTQSAVRKRIQRGTIPWEKDREGRVYVYVDPSEVSPETGEDRSPDTSAGRSRDELFEVYREQVDFLRRELERKDTIIMSLTQRIPELEAAPERRDAPEGAFEASANSKPSEPARRRSWLYRFFFGP